MKAAHSGWTIEIAHFRRVSLFTVQRVAADHNVLEETEASSYTAKRRFTTKCAQQGLNDFSTDTVLCWKRHTNTLLGLYYSR